MPREPLDLDAIEAPYTADDARDLLSRYHADADIGRALRGIMKRDAAVRERDATIADLRAQLALFVERERLDARMIDDPDDCTPDYLDPETR